MRSLRQYTSEFKLKIVKRIEEEGYSITQICRMYQLRYLTVQSWLDKFRENRPLIDSVASIPYPVAWKLQLMEQVVKQGLRVDDVAKQHGIESKLLSRWLTRYRYHMQLKPPSVKKYAVKFKLAIVKQILEQKASRAELAEKHGLAKITIANWIKQYRTGLPFIEGYTPRQHTAVFKEKTVKMVLEQGLSIYAVSQQEGLAALSLIHWIRDYKKQHPEIVAAVPRQQVLKQLRPVAIKLLVEQGLNYAEVCRQLPPVSESALRSWYTAYRQAHPVLPPTAYIPQTGTPRKYPEAMRQEAIKLVLEQGFSINSVAKRYEINSATVFQWVKKYKQQHQAIDSEGFGSDLVAESLP